MEEYILIDPEKLKNTNMIIIVPKTFKKTNVYPKFGKEVLLIASKHSWDEKAYFPENLQENPDSTFSTKQDRTNRLGIGMPEKALMPLQFKTLLVLNLKACTLVDGHLKHP